MGEADLIIDGVGGPTFHQLLYLAKPAGRIVIFGATSGPIPELSPAKMFFKQLDIRGTTMGSPQEFGHMLRVFEEHHIRPVLSRTYSLEEAAEALFDLEGNQNFGKITLGMP
ncbi:zinc-binding dehydrogenase [Paenibacillus sp. N3.4]|uniref:zinc-binding dehydrogenase n=1 Tax=Paenibacillus sp. N3.4 TaxID=2603222 RepID=UPI0021C49251|nr:zinc-binding dehydrogenase [Paenibacillus sp. N3.4]